MGIFSHDVSTVCRKNTFTFIKDAGFCLLKLSLMMITDETSFATKSRFCSLLVAHPNVLSHILWPTSSHSEADLNCWFLLLLHLSLLPHCWSFVTAAAALESHTPERSGGERETIREGRPCAPTFPLRGLFFLQVDGASGAKAIHLYHLIQKTHY